MKTLAEKMKDLRGSRNYVQFAEFTGVNRQSLADAEAGEGIRLSTLKRVAIACKLDRVEWTEMLISWVQTELKEEAHLLEIRRAGLEVAQFPASKREVNLGELLCKLFSLCSTHHQAHILKALGRPTVLDAVEALNRLWESQPSPNGDLAGLAERLADNWKSISLHDGQCSIGLIATFTEGPLEESPYMPQRPLEKTRSRRGT